MTIQLKSSLIIVATLLLGMGVGAWGGIQIAKSKIAVAQQEMRNQKGIARMLEKHIQPTPEQREAMKPIVQKHRPRFRALRQTQRQEWAVLADSLLRDIDPLLTDEQRNRVENRRKQFRKRIEREEKGNAAAKKQGESYQTEK